MITDSICFVALVCLTLSLLGYSVKENHVQSISMREKTPCDVKEENNNVVVNCSVRSLNNISESWFPKNTTVLMLQGNLLEILPNSTFDHLHQLQRLSLQDNVLTYLEPGSFSGLHNLKYLNLENNRLQLLNLPVYIFSNLTSLTDLLILQKKDSYGQDRKVNIGVSNNNNNSFPDKMFISLKNLTTLSVTVSSETLRFNDDFDSLTKLLNLRLSGSVSYIEDDSFKNVRKVENLDMFEFHNITNWSEMALGCFQSLKYINYQTVEIGLHKALQTLRPLVNTEVKYLRFSLVSFVPNLKYIAIATGDGILDEFSTQYLRNICVEELHLEENNIFIIMPGAFDGIMLHCLKILYITKNPIIGTTFSFFKFIFFSQVRKLVIKSTFGTSDNLDDSISLPRHGTRALHSRCELIQSFIDQNLRKYSVKQKFAESEIMEYSKRSCGGDEHSDYFYYVNITDKYPTEYFIKLSSSLEYIDISTIARLVELNDKITVSGGENLLYLNANKNGIRGGKFPISGLSNLKTLLFSYNNFSSLSLDFFNVYPSLEILNIDHCELSSDFISVHSLHIFQNLSNLQSLDLSFNSLDSLAPMTFSKNPNLSVLNLAGNRFRNIPFDLNLAPKLKYLDIRQNALTTISQKDQDIMESRLQMMGDFRLFLQDNILSCNCENIMFLQWLQQTDIKLDNSNYTCVNNEGVLSSTLTYTDLTGLWRVCWGRFFFNVSLILLSVIIISFLLLIIWIKNKTVIISGILQVFTGLKLKTSSDYHYGVFISYADKDYRFACLDLRKFVEVSLGLKVFIRDRDLSPGCGFAQSIVEAINSSWRVVLVINDALADEDEWFVFTIRSAVYSISPANPLRVVILVEDMYMYTLPSELLSSVPEDNVVVVTQWQLTDKLKQTLRTVLL